MSHQHLRSDALTQLADYDFSHYFEHLAPSVTWEDLFVPMFWAHHRAKLRQFDIVRVRAHDGSFDADLTVAGLPLGGVIMEYRAGRPPKNAMSEGQLADFLEAERCKITVVPLDKQGDPVVRIQHLPATKWRLLGLNSEEVIRDLPTKAKAEAELAKYLEQLQMRMPSEAEISAAKQKAA